MTRFVCSAVGYSLDFVFELHTFSCFAIFLVLILFICFSRPHFVCSSTLSEQIIIIICTYVINCDLHRTKNKSVKRVPSTLACPEGLF